MKSRFSGNTLNSLLSQKNSREVIFLKLFSVIVLIISFILLLPNSLFHNPAVGLDPSWKIALNLAVKNGFRFGKDFIFTYGPLGFLATRSPLVLGKTSLLFLDVTILSAIIFILSYAFKNLKSYASICGLFLIVLILSFAPIYSINLDSILFLIFLFMLFYYIRHGSIITLVLASIISIITFYLKINTGFLMFFIMFIIFIYIYIYPNRYTKKFFLGYFFIYLVLLCLFSFGLNTDLISYIKTSIHIANAYNDAMFIKIGADPDVGVEHLQMALTIIFLYSLIIIIDFKSFINNKEFLVGYILTGISIFSLFKIGFVRADGHIYSFFVFIPSVLGLLYLFTPSTHRGYLTKVILVALIFSFSTIGGRLYNLERITNKLVNFQTYINTASNSNPRSFNPAQLQESLLPEDFLQVIGDQTVDVIPWEVSYVYANDLNYSPRPVIQSYSAYNGSLDFRNYNKYVSDSAPQFILFSVNDIDGRHPFFTESRTKLAILTRYKIVDKFNNLLLLQKRKVPVHFSVEVQGKDTAELGEFIYLDNSDELQYMTIGIKYSLLGTIVRALFQPPQLNVTLQFDNGEEQTYRAIKTIVNGGVLVNKFVDTLDSAEGFFNSGGVLGRRVKKIKFDTPDRWGFQKSYTYQIELIKVNHRRFQIP